VAPPPRGQGEAPYLVGRDRLSQRVRLECSITAKPDVEGKPDGVPLEKIVGAVEEIEFRLAFKALAEVTVSAAGRWISRRTGGGNTDKRPWTFRRNVEGSAVFPGRSIFLLRARKVVILRSCVREHSVRFNSSLRRCGHLWN